MRRRSQADYRSRQGAGHRQRRRGADRVQAGARDRRRQWSRRPRASTAWKPIAPCAERGHGQPGIPGRQCRSGGRAYWQCALGRIQALHPRRQLRQRIDAARGPVAVTPTPAHPRQPAGVAAVPRRADQDGVRGAVAPDRHQLHLRQGRQERRQDDDLRAARCRSSRRST